jgi:hypothetical protein
MEFCKLIRQINFHLILLSSNGLRNQKRKREPQTRSQKLAAVEILEQLQKYVNWRIIPSNEIKNDGSTEHTPGEDSSHWSWIFESDEHLREMWSTQSDGWREARAHNFNQTGKTNLHFLSFIIFGDEYQVSRNESETKRQGVKEPGVYIFRVKNMSYKWKQQLLPEPSYLSAKQLYVKSCKKNKHVYVPKPSSGWV